MNSSGNAVAGPTGPWWDDYRSFLAFEETEAIPSAEQLCALLQPGSRSGGGKPLRFVPASAIPGVDYERHIYETGEVSTREGSWHDFFNALAWCRLPRLKAAMNALHHAHLQEAHDGRRGAQRDALTLLDESGAIVVSHSRGLLEALAARDWQVAFCDLRETWLREARVVVCGHGLLEKLRSPYKSVTAHALLLHVDLADEMLQAVDFLLRLDAALARLMADGLCRSPADLSPLPLMGIPGWWPQGRQDLAFYDDPAVFRAAPMGLVAAPVHLL